MISDWNKGEFGDSRCQQPHSTVLVCDRIITMQPGAADDATAVLIKAGRVVRLFRREQLAELADQDTRIVDLGRRALMPGFIDVHAHSEVVCRTAFDTIDCRAPECQSVWDVCDALISRRLAGPQPMDRRPSQSLLRPQTQGRPTTKPRRARSCQP